MSHLNVHRDNTPLLSMPVDHPAHRAILRHAECCESCVGKEIAWPHSKCPPIDQTWFSQIDQRTWTFSGFVYAFVSFDFVLDGWLNYEQHLQPFERSFLLELPRLQGLLTECEVAASAQANIQVVPLINQVRKFLDAFHDSIVARVGHVEIDHSEAISDSIWSTGR